MNKFFGGKFSSPHPFISFSQYNLSASSLFPPARVCFDLLSVRHPSQYSLVSCSAVLHQRTPLVKTYVIFQVVVDGPMRWEAGFSKPDTLDVNRKYNVALETVH